MKLTAILICLYCLGRCDSAVGRFKIPRPPYKESEYDCLNKCSKDGQCPVPPQNNTPVLSSECQSCMLSQCEGEDKSFPTCLCTAQDNCQFCPNETASMNILRDSCERSCERCSELCFAEMTSTQIPGKVTSPGITTDDNTTAEATFAQPGTTAEQFLSTDLVTTEDIATEALFTVSLTTYPLTNPVTSDETTLSNRPMHQTTTKNTTVRTTAQATTQVYPKTMTDAIVDEYSRPTQKVTTEQSNATAKELKITVGITIEQSSPATTLTTSETSTKPITTEYTTRPTVQVTAKSTSAAATIMTKTTKSLTTSSFGKSTRVCTACKSRATRRPWVRITPRYRRPGNRRMPLRIRPSMPWERKTTEKTPQYSHDSGCINKCIVKNDFFLTWNCKKCAEDYCKRNDITACVCPVDTLCQSCASFLDGVVCNYCKSICKKTIFSKFFI